MRFLADMGISPGTVQYLRQMGHDASHLTEGRRQRLEDSDILVLASQESRILLTHDLGFGDLLAASGQNLPGVVIFRLKDMRPDNVNRHLELALAAHGEALTAGAILSVSERRIRRRMLPL